MDCLMFRRLKSGAPRDVSPEMSQHMQLCEACAAFANEIDGFESRLENVLRVQVPDGIADAIILRHRRSHWLARPRQWLQLAVDRVSSGGFWLMAGTAAAAAFLAVLAALLAPGDRASL